MGTLSEKEGKKAGLQAQNRCLTNSLFVVCYTLGSRIIKTASFMRFIQEMFSRSEEEISE